MKNVEVASVRASMTEQLSDASAVREERLRIGPDRPCVFDGLEVRSFSGPRGRQYIMLKNPHTRTYVRLASDEYFLVPLMDGSREITDLVLAYFREYRILAFQRIIHVVDELRAHGFLSGTPPDMPTRLHTSVDERGWLGRLTCGVRSHSTPSLMFENADAGFDWLYRRGGWVLFTRPALCLLGVVALLGVVLPVWVFAVLGRDPLPQTSSPMLGLLSLVASFACVSIIHEAGHGLATKTFGREVRRAGAQLYFGLPAFVVDTTDMWMAPPVARMAVAGAGVLASWVVSGAAMLCVLALPSSRLTPFAYQCAFAGLVINLFNLIPLLELDGYYLLVDLLDMPLLRPRALAFVRRDLWRKLGTGQALDGEDCILGTFGVAAAAYSAFAVIQAAQFWLARIEPLVAGLGAMDPAGLRSVVIAAALALGAGVAAALAAAGGVGGAHDVERRSTPEAPVDATPVIGIGDGATVLADAPPTRPECWVSGDLVGNSNPATIATALCGQ